MRKIFTLLFVFLMVGTASAQDKWFNFLRNGTLSEDPVGGKFTNFTGRFGAKGTDDKAVVVEDPVDGQPALTLTTIAYNYQEQLFDEENNPVLDASGNPTFVNYYKGEDGSMISAIDDWATQFHVTIPHKFKAGEKFRLKFYARADKPVGIYAQAQSTPGNYLDNLNLYQDLTEEWQPFIYEGTDGEGQDAIDGMQTVSFNCNTNKTEVITIYFRFEEFCCELANTSEDERTFKRENLRYPIPAVNSEAAFKLDMTPMVEALGIENLAAYLNDNTMKLRVMSTVDDKTVVSYSGAVQPTTGAFIDAGGSMIEDETGVSICMPEDGINGNEVTLTLFNIDLNLEKGKTVKTRILFEKDNWFYGYDVMLMTPEDFDNPNSGSSGVVYSWESPDGNAIETGGKATFEGGEEGENRINYLNSPQGVDYYTLSLNGKKDNIDDDVYQKNATPRIIITLDDMFYGGEEIQVTAFTNKNDASKLSTPYFKFENGTTLSDDSKTFADLGIVGNSEPTTNTYEVPADAIGSKWFKMSRSKASTNLFITKLVIIGNASTGITEVREVKVDNANIYNLAGQRVDDAYQGIVIKNGRKFLVK
jgi:hypothetical protein